MPTETLDRSAAIYHFALPKGLSSSFERNANGTAILRDFPVFKVGTFRNSWGEETIWSFGDLEAMVANFISLRDANILPNVPHRVDHSRTVDRVCGYYLDLRIRNEFLLADVELTEPDAADKYERGTYRGRSAEIGPFQTNADDLLFPVFLGAAFVDIPAVEGLNFSQDKPDHGQIRYFTEATSMPTIVTTGTQSDIAPAPAEVATTDTPVTGGMFAGANVTITQPAATATPPAAAEPAGAPQLFAWGDEMITADELQKRATALSTAQAEMIKAARTEFAAQLVTERRFTAPQQEALTAFFAGLSVEQFEAAKAVYALAPELSLLANHGDGISNADGTTGGPGTDERQAEMDRLEGVVRQFTLAGKPQEWIEKNDYYKRLQVLKTA